MLQNALDLRVSRKEEEVLTGTEDNMVPVWAEASLTALSENGLTLDAQTPLTRGEAAKLLYQTVRMKNTSVFTQ